MYISAATLVARPGRSVAVGEHVGGMRGVIAKITGLEVSAWATLQGAPMGTFVISVRHDTMSDYIDASAKLGGDPDYHVHSEALGDLMVAPAERVSNQVIARTGDGDGAPDAFVSVTTAVISGAMSEALMWATEVQNLNKEITGLDGALATANAGGIMTVTWLVGFESGGQIDAATVALNADPRWAAKMESATSLFVPASGQRMLLAQLP